MKKINITKNDKNDLVFDIAIFQIKPLLKNFGNFDFILENYDEFKKVYARGGEISR